jgi:hypothetical protein
MHCWINYCRKKFYDTGPWANTTLLFTLVIYIVL